MAIDPCTIVHREGERKNKAKKADDEDEIRWVPENGKEEGCLREECGEMKGQHHSKCQTNKEYF